MDTVIQLECSNCGVTFNRKKKDVKYDGRKFFCSKRCQNKYRVGERNPCWRGGKIDTQCVVCGDIFLVPKNDSYRRKTCSYECRNIYIAEWQKQFSWLKGLPSELHPNWQGGKSFEQYPKEFHNIRKSILLRDEKCIECNTVKKLCVHHIDYNKNNNKIENLITLCCSCHSKTNYNREIWKKRYESYAIQQ